MWFFEGDGPPSREAVSRVTRSRVLGEIQLQDFHAMTAHGSISIELQKGDEAVSLVIGESRDGVKDVDVTLVRIVWKA
jgi:hypothetical protein